MFTIAILPQDRVFYARRLRPILVDPADVPEHLHTVIIFAKQHRTLEQSGSRISLDDDPELVEHAMGGSTVLHQFPEVESRIDDNLATHVNNVGSDYLGQTQVAAGIRVLLEKVVNRGYEGESRFLGSRIWKRKIWIAIDNCGSVSLREMVLKGGLRDYISAANI